MPGTCAASTRNNAMTTYKQGSFAMSAVLLCAALLCMAGSRGHPASQADPATTNNVFMWEVRAENSTAFLLGSIRFASKDLYPLDRRIEDSFNSSSNLVVELDFGKDQIAMQEIFRAKACMTNGLMLEDMVSDATLENSARDVDRVLTCWKTGDADAYEKLMMTALVENRELAPVYEELYFKRNVQMTGRLEQYLEKGGAYFVVIGSGHLVGKKGIIQLLKGTGKYSVRQLQ